MGRRYAVAAFSVTQTGEHRHLLTCIVDDMLKAERRVKGKDKVRLATMRDSFFREIGKLIVERVNFRLLGDLLNEARSARRGPYRGQPTPYEFNVHDCIQPCRHRRWRQCGNGIAAILRLQTS